MSASSEWLTEADRASASGFDARARIRYASSHPRDSVGFMCDSTIDA